MPPTINWTIEKLLTRTVLNPSTGCQEWSYHRQKKGYGRIVVKNRKILAHRFAWELSRGPIPEGLHVLHSCDNPPCCNPEHLFLGADQDNSDDKIQKGRGKWLTGPEHWTSINPEKAARGDRHGSHTMPERWARGDRSGARTKPECVPRGVRHGMAKLTDDDIRAIRRGSDLGRTGRAMAVQFGVSAGNISQILTGKNWKSVK